MPSFDVVCEANMVEVKNAIDQSNKEIATRFDFKGSDARVEQKESEMTLYADYEFKLGQVQRRPAVDKWRSAASTCAFSTTARVEKIGGDKVKQVVKIRKGVVRRSGEENRQVVKDARSRSRPSIQGDAVRITGAKRDDLQASIALLKKYVTDTPLDFNNFRD